MTIDTVEYLLWRRHFFKAHLNPKMKNRQILKDFDLPDTQALGSWFPFVPSGGSSWTPSKFHNLIFSNSLPLLGKIFLHRDSSTFKAANSAWTCSLVPGISDKIVFWLPSLKKVMRIFCTNFYTFCHIAGPIRGRFFLSARGWGVG